MLKKKQLENLLHPLIYQQIKTEIKALNTPYCIVSIPLLIETQHRDFVDRILVIDCPISMQITRVKQRDTVAKSQIMAIIDSQVSRGTRLAAADDIINNTQTILELAPQVKTLHNSYLLLSSTLGRTVCGHSN